MPFDAARRFLTVAESLRNLSKARCEVPKLGSSSRPLLFVDQATEHVPPAHLSGSSLATLGKLTGARVLRAPGHGAVARL